MSRYLLIFLALSLASCAFAPRLVDVNVVEPRIPYPRESFGADYFVSFSKFEDRRANPLSFGVVRNKLMMVTAPVEMSGDLNLLYERVVRSNFLANGISDGESDIEVKGAVLDATTDAVGPDNVFVKITVSLTMVDRNTNVPMLHRVITGYYVSPVTQISNMAWEEAFIGAFDQINNEIQNIALVASTALKSPINNNHQNALPKLKI